MHYQPMTEANKQEMLKEMGVSSFEDLLKGIPAKLRSPKIEIGEGLSELEMQALLTRLGAENRNIKNSLSFLGGGSYEHFIPAAVSQITSRNEFYTAYTPYQAEASQGTLQAIYEYQSLITELTGLDVSNASHYDGATSFAEAGLLACRHTDRTRLLVAKSVHPHYVRVLKTYLDGTPYRVETFGFDAQGFLDKAELEKMMGLDVAAVMIQSPNFLGLVENLEGLSERLHENGTLLVMTSHPLSLGIFKSPGEWGADVAVGEGQPLGIPPSFGGPYLGYFAVTRTLMRRIPGRLAGMTKDADGKRAFCLTLQAREQHIRRERAASNICTNQALCALAACVYMTFLGKEGIREVAEINLDRAYYLREQISRLTDFSVNLQAPIFNEFMVETKKDFRAIEEKLLKKNIFPGIGLGAFYPELSNRFLVCATETKTKEDLDLFVEALKQC